MSRLKQLTQLGQAVWLDYIRRDLLDDGALERLVREDGVSGVTSNPAIFREAIAGSELYDSQIRSELESDPDLEIGELYERLVFSDIRRAADILLPVYEGTAGADGFVSLEVSPHLARDADGTIAEAQRFWQAVDRPNLMIKVPATAEGVPAVEELLAGGINVNITLMFSLAHYDAVAAAYLRGVERHSRPREVASVASFFVSRVDSLVDRRLAERDDPRAGRLAGKVAVANSKLTYARFRELFDGPAFAAARASGARPQRVLWASTSTKNPAYSDVLYVEELIGPATVNTLPPATIEAFRDHGTVGETLTEGLDEARRTLDELEALGVSLDELTEQLQRDGLEKFAQPFDELLASLAEKRESLLSTGRRR
jgi:transaldolase